MTRWFCDRCKTNCLDGGEFWRTQLWRLNAPPGMAKQLRAELCAGCAAAMRAFMGRDNQFDPAATLAPDKVTP